MDSIALELKANTGYRIDSLTISTEQTYEDSEVILTSKLIKTSETEILTIIPIDIGIDFEKFNAVYFITVGTNEVNVPKVTMGVCNVSQFFFAVNRALTKIDNDCLSCDGNLKQALTIDLYLEALKHSLILKRNTDAITNFFALRRLCEGSIDDCKTGCSSGYGILNGDFIIM